MLIRKARFGVPQLIKTFTRKEDAEAWGRKTESEIERGAWRDAGGADRMTSVCRILCKRDSVYS